MIRAACAADVPAILEIYAPYILHTAYTFEYEVPTREAFLQRFQTITAAFPWLVWEEEGEILGYVYADRAFSRAAYQWVADLSVYLCPKAHGRGIGRQLYTAAENILRKLGYFSAYGIVTADNEGSCAFHRAMGYRQTALLPDCGWKLGQWHGVIWFEKRLREGEPHGEPVPWKGEF